MKYAALFFLEAYSANNPLFSNLEDISQKITENPELINILYNFVLKK
jgi:hypothetical protein